MRVSSKMAKKFPITPPPEVPNFFGPIGESIFPHPLWWCLDQDKKQEVKNNNLEMLTHIFPLKDERLLLITGALIVENTIDNFLSDFMPGYNSLKENRDFTFSMKIGLAKALALCPASLFNYCNLIRQIRNEFAHNLQIKKIVDLPNKHKQTLLQYLKELYPTYDESSSFHKQIFDLVNETIFGLEMYRTSVQRLNKLIRSNEIEDMMKEYFLSDDTSQ